MKLSADDLALFFRLQASLMLYANQQVEVLPNVRDETALEEISMDADQYRQIASELKSLHYI